MKKAGRRLNSKAPWKHRRLVCSPGPLPLATTGGNKTAVAGRYGRGAGQVHENRITILLYVLSCPHQLLPRSLLPEDSLVDTRAALAGFVRTAARSLFPECPIVFL